MTAGTDENGGETEVEGDLESMQGVEPEVGLMRWVEEVRELVCSSAERFAGLEIDL